MYEPKFTIGHLARETGCKITTIRYYEHIGLLPEPGRSEGNTRLYEPTHEARLAFILHCRELGFSQSAIRELLELTDQPESSCDTATHISKKHLEEVNQKIAQLTALKAELEHMITACSGGNVGQCRLIETLADRSHEHCISVSH
ncbi:MAG: helix-turn-helix domain-containing protein [Gammaproteobacteria bacterium]